MSMLTFRFYFKTLAVLLLLGTAVLAKDTLITPAQEKAAKEFETNFLKYQKPAALPVEALKRQVKASSAYQKRSFYEAISALEGVIKDNPKDLSALLMMADSYIQNANEYSPNEKQNALMVAMNAYLIASDPLDKAVAVYAMAMIDHGFQDALKKQRFSRQEIEARYNALLSDYPKVFAVYDAEQPETSAVGTICLSLSKPLLKTRDFHYEDYVSIDPQVKDLSVVAKGNRLCISGLAFGSTYSITLKKGLRGERDYKLAEDAVYPVLVSHRKPSIVFRERGYILPAKGPQLLPLKSINVPKVHVKVLRIPSQNLPNEINQNSFLTQLGSWRIDDLKDSSGELIGEGTFDCQGNLDEAVVKGLPIDQILGKKIEPGVYVVQAQVGKGNNYEENQNATQWFVVSDIGLSTFSGPDGLHVLARSLSTATSLDSVVLNVVARNGRVLATGQTDKDGAAYFDEKLLAGKDSNRPALIQATYKGNDFTFISFKREGFDFSDRGVKGRNPAHKADAYVYTERGIYRPGESVRVMCLLRDQNGKALTTTPLTFRVFRPDGIEVQTQVTKDAGAGAHTFEIETQAASYTGQWSVTAHLDPKAPEIGRATFRVNDFVPPRIDVKSTLPQKVIKPFGTLDANIVARYFYGPFASGLNVDGIVELVEANTPFEKWKDYQFGLEEETWTPLKFKTDQSKTNDQGQATVHAHLNAKPDSTKMLSARSVVTVFEPGGRGQSATQSTLFWHQPYAIGIAGQFKDRTAQSTGQAGFNIIAVDETGAPKQVSGLKYTLYEETHGFTWFRSHSQWSYEVTIEDRAISNGTIDLKAGAPTEFKVPVQYGFYRLEVMDDKTGVATSYRFHAGWSGVSELPDRPDMIEMTLDKPSYKVGDNAQLNLVTPFDGELVVLALGENGYQQVHRGKATTKATKVDIPLDAKMGQKAGVYLMAIVFRPGDVKAEKMPGRAIGLVWVDMKKDLPQVNMTIKAPEVIRPEKTFEAEVCVSQPLKNLYVAVAAVDEALLQLTEYKSPNPFDYIFAQTSLAYTVRDSYGQLINPFGAKPGVFTVGGDGMSASALKKLAVRTFKTVSLFSGIVKEWTPSNEKGCAQKAKISFTVPDFSGKVRLMGVAWNEDAVGAAESAVTVREALETYIALPRFLAPGDTTTVVVDAQNLTGATGNFKLKLQTEGEVALGKDFVQELTLTKEQMVHLPVELKAKNVGIGKLVLSVEGPNGIALKKEWQIAVRSSVFEITQMKVGVLKPDAELKLDASMLSAFNNGRLELSIGSVPTFGAERLRQELKKYPYNCLEQLTSRIVAEMYAPQDKLDRTKVADIVEELMSYQHFDGTFSLWAAQGQSEAWLSVYAIDLLNKTHNQQVVITPMILNRGMDWLKERVRQPATDRYTLSVQAYAHYVLAKEGQGTLGSLKYFADNNQVKLTHRSDQAFVAAAFALYGDAKAAETWFNKASAAKALAEPDAEFFQSWLSECAILVALMAETTKAYPKLVDLAQQLADQTAGNQWLSTFEKAWLIRAADALSKQQAPFKLFVNNEDTVQNEKSFSHTFSSNLLTAPVLVKNINQTPLMYTLTSTGEPKDPSSIANKGFELIRELYTLNGKKVDPAHVKSGDLMMVVLTGQLKEPNTHEVMVLDLLPAGLEIETTKFDENMIHKNFEWLAQLTTTSRVEKRDDRFFAAFRATKPGKFTLAYLVRAINPGTYVYPSATVESMYRPQFSARTKEGKLIIKE
jgi:uncharacterized protein YfaS (alpha-2-macroglobulin family)